MLNFIFIKRSMFFYSLCLNKDWKYKLDDVQLNMQAAIHCRINNDCMSSKVKQNRNKPPETVFLIKRLITHSHNMIHQPIYYLNEKRNDEPYVPIKLSNRHKIFTIYRMHFDPHFSIWITKTSLYSLKLKEWIHHCHFQPSSKF